jgi:CrcB protein
VNVLGCLVIGFAWAFAEESPISPASQLFFLTGILGAFTTFSTFGIDTISLVRQGEITLGITNVIGSNAAGLLAVVLGYALARLLVAAGHAG